MININQGNLYIGSKLDLGQTNEMDWAFVHATQTIHYKIMGWDRKYNKPDKYNPNYILYENSNHLSLNWVDGDESLYDWSGPETFIKVLDFIDKFIKFKKILIHCDQGQSRAPTIGLLYLAKRLKIIPNDSFKSSKDDFIKLYPGYYPMGIGMYVEKRWLEIN